MIVAAWYIRTLQLSVDRWCMYTMHVLHGGRFGYKDICGMKYIVTFFAPNSDPDY